IIPHSLVDSGLRWHVRAFDRTQGHFRDSVLTRMAQVQPVQGSSPVASEERVNADAQWHRELTLTLVPHPAHPHPKVIARDFGMRRGQLSVTLKAAMAGYVLRQWQVDCSPDARLRGPEFRLWLPDRTQLNGVVSAPLAPGFEDSEAP
ncbi:MAG: WYL domain-containing protein, partial [Rhodoferax sp.]|nr:WYL domain-containing protein [Rhodoferax sp.]